MHRGNAAIALHRQAARQAAWRAHAAQVAASTCMATAQAGRVFNGQKRQPGWAQERLEAWLRR